ncbi:alpha/beta hydrolase [Nonlabens xiamenensis]|uniref:alpha/beta hydrolase n=1 Tax=Nonlabens xiamenensis TaxID=2341043 RepID=UPI000F60A0B7|nr:esterase [Nonlabens xiamenensis]
MVKTVSYQHTNSYETLNDLSTRTEKIWVCLHGLGYLATFFKKYFSGLDPEKNYVIVPQAPSKYYQGKDFKHVGASWLTRVDTQREMNNNINYLQQILEQEGIVGDPRLVFFGYSQGVSIVTRFCRSYAYEIKALIMHSGSIPAELDETDGQHFQKYSDRIIHISGTEDEYSNEKVLKRELQKIKLLFSTECEIHRPEIKHVVHTPLIEKIAQSL